MAELLIKAVDATHADPVKDERGCYKRGDVVEVYEDGRCSEPVSPNSPFYILKIPGLAADEMRKYMQGETDQTGEPLRRRAFKFDLDALPAPIKGQLGQDKEFALANLKAAETYLTAKGSVKAER